MNIVAHARRFVVGVDTHARTHDLAILVAATGELLVSEQFPTTSAGVNRAISWVGRWTGGDLDALWVIEGVATFGARLARVAAEAGYQVVEAARMSARSNRGIGKSDLLDARRIAAAVLPLGADQLRYPRRDGGLRAALRVLVSARDQMSTERTADINAITALLRAFELGVDARRRVGSRQAGEIARWRSRDEDVAVATARSEAIRLAKRIVTLDAELQANRARIDELQGQSPAVALLEKTGVGPVTAAVAFVAWSHHGRVRSEAAFASLAGVNPIPASSGNTTRHRLNRGGDRQLNRALHIATVTRMAHDPVTRDYVDRRRAEGRTNKEIRRILKRYLARQVFRTLTAAHAHAAT